MLMIYLWKLKSTSGILLCSAICILLTLSCTIKRYDESRAIIKNMTIKEKIGQMIMVGVPGSRYTNRSERILRKYLPGGIILFGFNLSNEKGTRKFIEDLQRTSMQYSGIPLFVSIDQEGGRVKRIIDGVTQFPGNMAIGVVDDEEVTGDLARIIGMQLRLLGINMNLAPVVDVNNNPANPVINTRSFGSSPEVVARMAVAYIEGLQQSRCIAVAKHFPGHGDTDKDSHITLPVIPHSLQRLKDVELKPFVAAIDADVEAIMTAHIAYPKVLGNNLPVTVSPLFLRDILRQKLEFEGIVITDDMEMDAITRYIDLGEAAVQSIKAGADIVLISTHGYHVPLIVRSIERALQEGRLTEERLDDSVIKIVELKLRYGIMDLVNGAIIPARVSFSENDHKLLSESEKINEKVSREAMYFHGTAHTVLPTSRSGDRSIFITDDPLLTRVISHELTKAKIVKNGARFIRFCNSHLKIKSSQVKSISDVTVFYHVEKLNRRELLRIIAYTERHAMRLTILCSGNPFLLSGISSLPPVLFSFSNTLCSKRAMIRCLRGEYSPRTKININLGF